MTGCFDNSVGDAEGAQDDPADDNTSPGLPDVTTDSGGSATDQTSSQERIWYSTGETIPTTWHDGMTGNYNGERCLEYGSLYNSSTGEYIGEECTEYRQPESADDWNLTDCTDNGGEAVWGYDVETYHDYYDYAPSCRMSFATINTTIGEALMIFEMSNFYLSSTCDGVTVYTSTSALSGKEYIISPGTALSCSHELYNNRPYSYSESQFDSQVIWSIVYAIQDTTVV